MKRRSRSASWIVPAPSRRTRRASFGVRAGRYGRCEVMASYASTMATIRLKRAGRRPLRDGYPPPSMRTWCSNATAAASSWPGPEAAMIPVLVGETPLTLKGALVHHDSADVMQKGAQPEQPGLILRESDESAESHRQQADVDRVVIGDLIMVMDGRDRKS